MALVLKDRVKETTATTGTGTVTLAGAVAGFSSFSVIGNGNTTYYAIVAQTPGEWEVGIGTYTASGTTLARTTILASSNSNAAVNFSAGIKDVFVTYPADKSVNLDASGNVSALGTVASGTWQGSAVGVAYGGTGQTSYIDGQILIGNTTGNTLTKTTLTAGCGVTITNGAGSITIAASGGGGASPATPTVAGVVLGKTEVSVCCTGGSTALGSNAGLTCQGRDAVAIGFTAGQTNQSDYAVAIGSGAGCTSQGGNAVAIGRSAGEYLQGGGAVAIGVNAGRGCFGSVIGSGALSVAIGANAGRGDFGVAAVAIGSSAAACGAAAGAVAIGQAAGLTYSPSVGLYSVAIGFDSGQNAYGNYGVGIGYVAGWNQFDNAVAIGAYAGYCCFGCGQPANSIVINATGAPMPATGACRTHIGPMRNATGPYTLYYCATTREITYN